MKARLILVGGFLGAGKTTLLWEAANRLAGRGRRAGLITNDQAPELVDTAYLAHGKVGVSEVSGSCFCCNFRGLVDAVSKLRAETDADVLVAEPVGSCTDLSATIIQPLKDLHGMDVEVAPLTVMADPARLADILRGGTAGLHSSAAYIYRKQLEEADIVVVSKSDSVPKPDIDELKARLSRVCPGAAAVAVSARSGQGVDEWLDMVTTRQDAGTRIANVDYDTYSEGEAVLGWLNASFVLRGAMTEWRGFAESLLNTLGHLFNAGNYPVGHVKLIIESGDGFVMGNLTGDVRTINVRGSGTAGAEARMTLNARVQMEPQILADLVRTAVASVCEGRLDSVAVAWKCLSPGRPNPTYRYSSVIAAGS